MNMNAQLLKISYRLFDKGWNALTKAQRDCVLDHYYDYY